MLISGLLYVIYAFIFLLTLPFRLLPDVSEPAIFSSTVSQASQYLTLGHQWLPLTVDTLLLTWGLFLALEVVIFSYKGIMWVVRKIPGIS